MVASQAKPSDYTFRNRACMGMVAKALASVDVADVNFDGWNLGAANGVA